jgi:hypothetical protein
MNVQNLLRTLKYIAVDNWLDASLASDPKVRWIEASFRPQLLRIAIVDEVADVGLVSKEARPLRFCSTGDRCLPRRLDAECLRQFLKYFQTSVESALFELMLSLSA